MYALYLNGVRYPVTPKALKTKINNRNKTITLINDGEINQLKTAGLTDISFELLLPQLAAPSYAVYPEGFQPAAYYLGLLEELKTGKEPFQFIVSRTWGRTTLFDTNMTVSLEKYTIKEDKNDGSDIAVEVELKQFRAGSTKVLTVKTSKDGTRTATVTEQRATTGKVKETTYTTKNGDTLSYIARSKLQDSSRYSELYALNKDAIEAAAKAHGLADSAGGTILYPGTLLQLPE